MATSCREKVFFITAGYCFPQLPVLLLGRSIRRAEGGVDYTNLCCISLSQGDHLPRVHSQRRDLLNHVECKFPRYLGFGWPRHKHKHISAARVYVQMHLHAVILALMHNQKHACSCTCTLSDSAHGDLSDLYPHSVTVHIQQNSRVITRLNLWQQRFLMSQIIQIGLAGKWFNANYCLYEPGHNIP